MSGEVGIVLERTAYRPGERVAGQAVWHRDKPPRQASIRLFWRVRGARVDDVKVVDVHDVAQPQAAQDVAFEFTLPDEPYSYRGTLFSIEWGVELLVGDSGEVATFTLGPG